MIDLTFNRCFAFSLDLSHILQHQDKLQLLRFMGFRSRPNFCIEESETGIFTAVAVSAVSMMTAYETTDCLTILKSISPELQLEIRRLLQTKQCSSALSEFLTTTLTEQGMNCDVVSLLRVLCPGEHRFETPPRTERLLSQSLLATKEALLHEARDFATDIAYDKNVLDEIDERLSFPHGPGCTPYF